MDGQKHGCRMTDPVVLKGHHALVLKRLYLARKARRETKRAMSEYLRIAWEEDPGDEVTPPYQNPNKHKFGQCGLGQKLGTGYDDAVPILCEVCAGSETFYNAMRDAAREAGNALRQAQAIGKSLAEGK